MTNLIVVALCVLGVSGTFQAIYAFWPLEDDFKTALEGQNVRQRSKLKNRLESPRNTQNAQKHNDNEASDLYFFIFDNFLAIYEIELNSHTKS